MPVTPLIHLQSDHHSLCFQSCLSLCKEQHTSSAFILIAFYEYLYSPNTFGRRINSKKTIKTTQLQIRQKKHLKLDSNYGVSQSWLGHVNKAKQLKLSSPFYLVTPSTNIAVSLDRCRGGLLEYKFAVSRCVHRPGFRLFILISAEQGLTNLRSHVSTVFFRIHIGSYR